MRVYRTENSIHVRRSPWMTVFWAVLFVLAGIVILLIIVSPVKPFSGNTPPKNGQAPAAAQPDPSELYRMTVPDQAAGKFVQITSLSVPEDAWAVIYEQRDGGPGNILGAARIRPEHTNGQVELLRGTMPGGTYYAVFHVDDGDIEFDFDRDKPLLGADGKWIMSSFTAQ